MKNITLTTFAILFILVKVGLAQSDYYMPTEIIDAYSNSTRSFDGKPGENYFQNYAEYNIKAELNPENKLLTGSETINYKNNSPDSLNYIIFNLYADIYKKGNMLDWSMGDIDLTDGVNIKSVTIAGKTIDLTAENVYRDNTTLIIELDTRILPKSETEIKVDWEYTVPSHIPIRQGTYNETSFFIGYWYPQIAVYDDLVGWNDDVYSGQTEFYHEYADYKVEITAPDEYFVLASGILQNPEDVLSKNILKKYNAAKTSDDIVNVIDSTDRKKSEITKGSEKNIWKFEATNLPDFSFCMSDTYLWDATSVEIGGKRVLVNSVYNKDNIAFNQVAEITQKMLKMLSDSVVGVNYPYPQMTAFMGHYGMEFPGMVNDGDGDYTSTVFVTAHEITHSYFPFYVATNEVKYAWMDEGLVTFLPKLIEDEMIERNNSFEKMIKTYNYYCGRQIDLPLMIPSDQLSGFAYRFHAYSKPAVAFYVLKQTLGKEMFYKCLVEFINRWNGKHPTGYDLFYTFENVSGEDLNWFFEPWFFDLGYSDLAINSALEISENKTSVEIGKIGNYPVPIKLTVLFDDNSTETVEINASVWKNIEKTYTLEIENTKKIISLTLGDNNIPDKNQDNNTFIF